MGKHKKQGGGAPPHPHRPRCDLRASLGVARQLLAGVLSAALSARRGPAALRSHSVTLTAGRVAVVVRAAAGRRADRRRRHRARPLRPAAHSASLRWGTWRPGRSTSGRLRSRTAPDALAAGLMWTARAADGGGGGGLRHSCKEGELGHYAYTAHDGRSYAAQEITDAGNGIALRTEFARPPSNDGWAVRIEGRAPDGAKGKATPQLVFFYVAVDAAHAEECRAGTDAYIRHAAAQIFRNRFGAILRRLPRRFRYGEALEFAPEAPPTSPASRRRSASFRSSHTARRSPPAKTGASAARGVGAPQTRSRRWRASATRSASNSKRRRSRASARRNGARRVAARRRAV